MRIPAFAIAAVAVLISSGAAAQHESTPPIQAFDHTPFVQAVADLHGYYILSPQVGGTLAERTNARNRLVRDLFTRIAHTRKPVFAEHRLKQSQHIRCKKSGSGGTKRCPAEINWGAGYQVIPESMGDTQRHFKDGPHNQGHKIVAVLGRAGAGTNTGDFWGTARLTEEEVSRRVESELDAFRAALTARSLPTDKALDMEVQ